MKSTRIMMMGLAAALTLAGCSKDENEAGNWNGEIRLSSGVTTLTRAFTSMDEQLPSGQTVAVYVDKTGGTPQLYGNNVLTADGDGTFTGGTTMYFPNDKSAVDIYAFHTNGTLTTDFPQAAFTHTVSADQSTEANYQTSDLLYAANKGVAFTKQSVPLTFYHILSKVQVAIKAGAGTPDLTGATLSISGTKLKANFTPDKSKDMATQNDRAGMIAPTAGDNIATDIKLSADPTTNEFVNAAVYNDAIIVPQTIGTSDPFIKVTLSNGTVLSHKLASATTFASGKKYQYHITVNLSGLTVTSTITNWDPVNAVPGTAEME